MCQILDNKDTLLIIKVQVSSETHGKMSIFVNIAPFCRHTTERAYSWSTEIN